MPVNLPAWRPKAREIALPLQGHRQADFQERLCADVLLLT